MSREDGYKNLVPMDQRSKDEARSLGQQGGIASGSEIHVCGYLLPFQAVQIVFAKSAVFGGVQLHKHGIDLRKQSITDGQLRVGAALSLFLTLHCAGEALPITPKSCMPT